MKQLSAIKTCVLLLALTLVLSSCSGSNNGGDSSGTSGAPKLPYCSSVTPYDNAITITGKAVYEFRLNGNGGVADPNPIRAAEVRVTDRDGNLIQCGETDASGSFSLSLPNDGSSVTIAVASRADNDLMKAHVMNNPTANSFYALTSTVVLDGTKSIGTLTAPATGSVMSGGAFNILDQIYRANEYLRNETNNCSATFNQCPEFSTAPLVDIYWARGVNPGEYFNFGPLSFYVPSLNHLYILGGQTVNGVPNVDDVDTDHFDNSVIIHEYGHALENLMSFGDSPGGPHNGNDIIDPRLAWSEGWCNFFQAAVLGQNNYRDTAGTPLGTAFVLTDENLEYTSIDTASKAGEGNFREFSISRALFDIIDPVDAGDPSGNDDLQSSFAELWTLFAGTNGGFADPAYSFRSLGLFYVLQAGLAGGSNWSTIQDNEDQLAARTHYANTLSSGSGCPTSITAANIPANFPEDGSFENSNMFDSNDFYQIDHPGGPLWIEMDYTTTGAANQAADLDLYLYVEDYIYGSGQRPTNMVALSEASISPSANSGSETIYIPRLAAGTYMLNIRYDTLNGIRSSGNYSLTINGQSQCPD